MQQRQPRLGDILDDYCPRERRLTNHAVVAMIGNEIKQTRCTTCDADHEYRHARVPRQRKKSEPAALYAAAAAPKKVVHEMPVAENPDEVKASIAASTSDESRLPEAGDDIDVGVQMASASDQAGAANGIAAREDLEPSEGGVEDGAEEGPVHRPLIRAQLPRIEGQPPMPRQAPDFTIRQPTGRANRFRPRHSRAGGQGQGFQGNRSNGNVPGGNMGNFRGGAPRRPGGPPPSSGGMPNRHGQGRKRSK